MTLDLICSDEHAERMLARIACASCRALGRRRVNVRRCHTAIRARTPSASMLAPSPPATISPRLMTQ